MLFFCFADLSRIGDELIKFKVTGTRSTVVPLWFPCNIDRAVVPTQSCVCHCPLLLLRYMTPIFSSFVVLWIPDFNPQWVRRSGCPEICDSDDKNSPITRRWGFKAKLLCSVENVNENRCLNRNLLPFWEGSSPSSLKVFILFLGRNLIGWPRNRANSLAISSTSGAFLAAQGRDFWVTSASGIYKTISLWSEMVGQRSRKQRKGQLRDTQSPWDFILLGVRN